MIACDVSLATQMNKPEAGDPLQRDMQDVQFPINKFSTGQLYFPRYRAATVILAWNDKVKGSLQESP